MKTIFRAEIIGSTLCKAPITIEHEDWPPLRKRCLALMQGESSHAVVSELRIFPEITKGNNERLLQRWRLYSDGRVVKEHPHYRRVPRHVSA